MKTRPYLFYGLTNSLCSQCLTKVEAKIIFENNNVYLLKYCPKHKIEKVLIANDIEYYKHCQNFIKEGEMPLKFNTAITQGCPYDCGLCPDHEQHSCLTLIEITDQCNLSCPICYADSGIEAISPTTQTPRKYKSLAKIEQLLNNIIDNEGEAQIVQLSGGEPTLHPDFFAIIELAKAKPIKHLMINTNGIKLAQDQDFCAKLSQYMPGIEVYLQFDSLRINPLLELRGVDLRKIRLKALENLNKHNISTTLVVTLKKGANNQEIGEIIEFALQQKSVRGVTFQPIQSAGRVENFDPAKHRYTLTEVRQDILNQSPYFKPEDILPVPCHPDCLAMAYALKFQDQVIPLTGLLNTQEFVKFAPNSVMYEQDKELRRKIFNLFSTSHSPDSSAISLKQLLCCLPVVPVPDNLNYNNIFRVMIVQFLDPYNFDVRSVKRSCIHIAHDDGRIIPFDTYNLFYREGSQGYNLINNLNQ